MSLANITAHVFCHQLPTFIYTVNLFKCQQDYYSPDNLREHLQSVSVTDDPATLDSSSENLFDIGYPKTDLDKNENSKTDDANDKIDAETEDDELSDRCQQYPDFNDEWKFNEVSVSVYTLTHSAI